MSGAPVESRRRLERGAQAVLGCGLERGCSRRREWGNNIGKGRERRCGERLLPPAGPGPALRLPARPLLCPAPSRAHSPPRAQRGTRREKQLWFRLSIFFLLQYF